MSISTSESTINDDENFKKHLDAELAPLKAEISVLREQLAGLHPTANPALVTIATAAGLSVTLDDSARTITLKDSAQNSVVLSQSGISLKSSGNLSLAATGNITLSAGTSVNLDAIDIALQASNQFSATGAASASVKSSGELTIRAAMVMIN